MLEAQGGNEGRDKWEMAGGSASSNENEVSQDARQAVHDQSSHELNLAAAGGRLFIYIFVFVCIYVCVCVSVCVCVCICTFQKFAKRSHLAQCILEVCCGS
jgi:hypothetical protein